MTWNPDEHPPAANARRPPKAPSPLGSCPLSTQERRAVRLARGEAMSLDEAWLCVERGRVWLTLAGDPADYFLDGGQTIRLPRGARAVVSAEAPTLLSLPGLGRALSTVFQRVARLRTASR